ncbi:MULTISPECIES: DedA family protein [Streptomyces]|uniref:DedA family protein n=1 Tax=Streptomyces mutomycini TaxID=284036 RepID=A0ABW0AXY1_9ACTN|nr:MULTISPECIES: DedA family protein [Streptomyces]KPC80002.1 membrane protein DedA family protein [Streptomyces sp. NRRL S-4]
MHLTYSALKQEPAGGIAGWATGLVDTMGGPGAGLAIALENLFPPLPSEVILPLTGFAAGQGVLSLASALFWTTLGSVVGAVVLYWIGVSFGRERMHTLWGKLPLVKASDLERTEQWFAKHGTKAVFFGRMVPLFRSLISVPAGVERMPVHVFVVLTTLGSLIWNSVLVMAGYWLGDRWETVETYVGFASKAVLVLVVVAVATYVALRLRGADRAQHRRSS